MKFRLNPDSGVMDKVNEFADRFIEKEKSMIDTASHPVWSYVKEQLIDLGHWTVDNIPEIMGYGAMLTGALVILGAIVGRGAYLKPIFLYGVAFIVAVVVRSGADA